MKRSITRWTTALAAAGLLALPLAAAAQQPSTPPQQQQPAPQPQPAQPQPAQPQPAQPQPTEPQPQQPTPAQPQPTQPQPTPQPTDPQPTQPAAPPSSTSQQPPASASADQGGSAEEHLREARAAFNDIKLASIPAKNRNDFAQLRRHLAALDNPSASAASPSATSRRGSRSTASTPKAENWGTEVAAIDKIITTLIGNDTATGTSGASSTTGATGTAGSSRSRATGVGVDETTRAKLMEVRTHITAYATAKAGTSSTPRSDANMANQTMASAAQSTTGTTGEPPRTGNYTTPPNAAGEPGAANAQPSAQNAATGAKVDAEAAHRSLLAARDALNQLTQLPAAAQLTGDARTQVQQLIAGFNELITNNSDWRPSYEKVSTTLTSLLGPDTPSAEATAGTPATATGTAGAVGTAGTATVQLDPALRAKLVEMRTNLSAFEKASGGVGK